MIQIILDSNIYDRLEQDAENVELLRNLIAQQAVEVLMPRQVAGELHKRKAGLPDLFPVEDIGHAVARAGVMCAGDYLGSGSTFDKHKGASNKDADAFIVDVAASRAVQGVRLAQPASRGLFANWRRDDIWIVTPTGRMMVV
ncbi:hypothetical protein [Burkholderia sp. Se-20378]|uniref:hypothetical protein n=1 Tax=Burkholderia sp. Se-20378 TaxID=2703899 RepID=UPI001F125A6C|nr:hypothetical protein [Burkholderia sp. Se-20378]